MCISHSLALKAYTIKLTPYNSHIAAKHSIHQLTSHLFIPLSSSPPTITSPRETSQALSSPLSHNKSRTEPTRGTATNSASTRARGNKRALRIIEETPGLRSPKCLLARVLDLTKRTKEKGPLELKNPSERGKARAETPDPEETGVCEREGGREKKEGVDKNEERIQSPWQQSIQHADFFSSACIPAAHTHPFINPMLLPYHTIPDPDPIPSNPQPKPNRRINPPTRSPTQPSRHPLPRCSLPLHHHSSPSP